MRRETKRFNQGDGVFKVVNRVFSDPVDRQSTDVHKTKLQFLKILADCQDILRCESAEYETLKIYFDGNCWIAESQAVIQER